MTYAYHAFLSYSRKDEAVAEALQQELSKLLRRPLRRRNLRIFRDRTGLQAGGGLEQRLQAALDASEWLVVLLSRDANSSKWVDAEIQHWFTSRQHAEDHLLIVRCDDSVDLRWNAAGTPVNPAGTPPALATNLRTAPLYVDLAHRTTGWEVSTAVQVAAGVLRRDPEDIASENLRQHVRARRLAMSAVAMLTAFAIVATAAGLLARSNAVRAERNAAEARSAQANAEVSEAEAIRQEQRAVDVALLAESGRREASAPEEALGLAVESFARSGSPDSLTAVRRVLAALPYGARFSQTAAGVSDAVLSPDDRQLALRYDSRIDVVSIGSMSLVLSIPVNPDGYSFEFLNDGALTLVGSNELVILASGASQAMTAPSPVAGDARVLAIRRGAGENELLVLWQRTTADQGEGTDAHLDRWWINSHSGDVDVERVRDLGVMPPMESGAISPLGNFAAVSAGSRWSFAEVDVRVFELNSDGAYQVPVSFRPWTVVLDDRSCRDRETSCTSVQVTVTGEPYEQERLGEVWIDTLDDGDWWEGTQFSLPSPLQVTAHCEETLLSGISGAWVVSGFGSIFPAMLGTDPPVAALCTSFDEWIVVEGDGTVIQTPQLRRPQTTATGIDTESWFVTEFAEVVDLFDAWPEDPSEVSLRPEMDGSLSVVVDGEVVATSQPPVGRTVTSEVFVDEVSPSFDQGISSSDLEIGVGMSGFDWSRVIDVRRPGSAPDAEPLWQGTFPDAPEVLLLMTDGSILGLFTLRGDYLVLRRIAYSDQFMVDLACQIGAVIPSDVSALLGLRTAEVPSACIASTEVGIAQPA